MSNNSETVRDTRNVSMNHDYETGVALWDSVKKTCVKRPPAEKSRWRHIHLAMKPRYFGSRASQMKSYWGTLSGNNVPFIIIRHENSPEAPPSGEITMTSHPACNKTSLSRKPCIPDKKLLWGSHGRTFRIRYYWSPSLWNSRSFRIHHKKSPEAPPCGEIMMTSYPVGNETKLSRKPCIPNENLLRNAISK